MLEFYKLKSMFVDCNKHEYQPYIQGLAKTLPLWLQTSFSLMCLIFCGYKLVVKQKKKSFCPSFS
jgi:hypothetical protein